MGAQPSRGQTKYQPSLRLADGLGQLSTPSITISRLEIKGRHLIPRADTFAWYFKDSDDNQA